MTNKSQRFIVWLFALLLVSSLVYKGHCVRRETRPTVAFLSFSSAGNTVRVAGDVSAPGIYRLPDGATIGTVINVTAPDCARLSASGAKLETSLSTGMVLHFKRTDSKRYEVSLGYMKAKERITLGIPLDLRFMKEEDWQALPGIGAKTAKEISNYRQNHGDFHSLEELEMVSGISEKKIEKIKEFFKIR